MNVLPRISGREVVRALRKIGYNRDRQRGSHIVLRRTAPPHQRITLPDHKEVTKGTLKAIIRQTGFTVDRPIEPTHCHRHQHLRLCPRRECFCCCKAPPRPASECRSLVRASRPPHAAPDRKTLVRRTGDGGRCRRHQLLYNVASRVHRPAWSYIR